MFQNVLDLIDRHGSFLISGHVNPDGDCLGTEVALYHFLKAIGKSARILNVDPPGFGFDFLLRHTELEVHREGTPLPEHEVHCLVDCNELCRLGSVGEEASRLEGIPKLVVDHHVGADRGDGDFLLWDVGACSSGVLVYDLFRKAGAPMNLPAAEGIFVSIVADTGWFRYSNTTGDALAIAADLVAIGVEPHRIYQKLFQRNTRESLRVLTGGLGRIRFESGGRMAVLVLDRSFMECVENSRIDTDAFLDEMRAIEGVQVCVLLKERGDGKIKLSLRGSDEFDVDVIARAFGGGGHRKAAGADLEGGLDQARARAVRAVRESLEV